MLLAIAVVVFLATLTLVIWQPKGLPIGFTALGGAAVALLTGVVELSDVPTVWGIVWNATITFVAVILISLVLDEAGFFEWAALHVARWGRGSGTMLFNLVVVLGAAIAAVFANDGAALILTPIVVQMLLVLRMPPHVALAFVMATGFVADTTSLPLVVSNLVNIVFADYFDIGFARYALVMVPVALASLVASLVVLRVYFRRSIPARYDTSALPEPARAIRDPLTFTAGWVVLAVLLVGYFAADPIGVPLAAVASLCAMAIVLVAARRPAALFTSATPLPPRPDEDRDAVQVSITAADLRPPRDGEERELAPGAAGAAAIAHGRSAIPVGDVLRGAPWQVVLFSIGMYLVVYGLRNQGLTDELARAFRWFAEGGTLTATGGSGFLVAGLSSVMNNLPTTLVAALSIEAAGTSGLVKEAMVYAGVVGADLGPKITPIGSLATLLWLHVLSRRGIHIGWGTYFRVGIVLTIPVLAVTLLALAGWLTVIGT